MRDAEAPIEEHHTGEGSTIFKHAYALGCEGIVSKRLGSPYRSGSNRSLDESHRASMEALPCCSVCIGVLVWMIFRPVALWPRWI
jgi:hypothetical protein